MPPAVVRLPLLSYPLGPLLCYALMLSLLFWSLLLLLRLVLLVITLTFVRDYTGILNLLRNPASPATAAGQLQCKACAHAQCTCRCCKQFKLLRALQTFFALPSYHRDGICIFDALRNTLQVAGRRSLLQYAVNVVSPNGPSVHRSCHRLAIDACMQAEQSLEEQSVCCVKRKVNDGDCREGITATDW